MACETCGENRHWDGCSSGDCCDESNESDESDEPCEHCAMEHDQCDHCDQCGQCRQCGQCNHSQANRLLKGVHTIKNTFSDAIKQLKVQSEFNKKRCAEKRNERMMQIEFENKMKEKNDKKNRKKEEKKRKMPENKNKKTKQKEPQKETTPEARIQKHVDGIKETYSNALDKFKEMRERNKNKISEIRMKSATDSDKQLQRKIGDERIEKIKKHSEAFFKCAKNATKIFPDILGKFKEKKTRNLEKMKTKRKMRSPVMNSSTTSVHTVETESDREIASKCRRKQKYTKRKSCSRWHEDSLKDNSKSIKRLWNKVLYPSRKPPVINDKECFWRDLKPCPQSKSSNINDSQSVESDSPFSEPDSAQPKPTLPCQGCSPRYLFGNKDTNRSVEKPKEKKTECDEPIKETMYESIIASQKKRKTPCPPCPPCNPSEESNSQNQYPIKKDDCPPKTFLYSGKDKPKDEKNKASKRSSSESSSSPGKKKSAKTVKEKWKFMTKQKKRSSSESSGLDNVKTKKKPKKSTPSDSSVSRDIKKKHQAIRKKYKTEAKAKKRRSPVSSPRLNKKIKDGKQSTSDSSTSGKKNKNAKAKQNKRSSSKSSSSVDEKRKAKANNNKPITEAKLKRRSFSKSSSSADEKKKTNANKNKFIAETKQKRRSSSKSSTSADEKKKTKKQKKLEKHEARLRKCLESALADDIEPKKETKQTSSDIDSSPKIRDSLKSNDLISGDRIKQGDQIRSDGLSPDERRRTESPYSEDAVGTSPGQGIKPESQSSSQPDLKSPDKETRLQSPNSLETFESTEFDERRKEGYDERRSSSSSAQRRKGRKKKIKKPNKYPTCGQCLTFELEPGKLKVKEHKMFLRHLRRQAVPGYIAQIESFKRQDIDRRICTCCSCSSAKLAYLKKRKKKKPIECEKKEDAKKDTSKLKSKFPVIDPLLDLRNMKKDSKKESEKYPAVDPLLDLRKDSKKDKKDTKTKSKKETKQEKEKERLKKICAEIEAEKAARAARKREQCRKYLYFNK